MFLKSFILILICCATTTYCRNITCTASDTCLVCLKDKGCSFWDCKLDDKYTNVTDCQPTAESSPLLPCTYGGKWRKVENSDQCPEAIPTTTTTTTTPTTITTTPNTTTTTANITTTTTPTSTTKPDVGTNGKSFWTIFSIVLSSLIVFAAISVVSYLIIRKKYFSANEYRTLTTGEERHSIFSDVDN